GEVHDEAAPNAAEDGVEVRAREVCVAEVRAGKNRAAEIRAGESRVHKVRAAEVRVGEGRTVQNCACEGRASKVRAGESRVAEVYADEVRLVEIRAGKVRPVEVDPVSVATRLPTPDDCEGRLNVRPRRALIPRSVGPLGNWPLVVGVFPDERGEDLHHCGVVCGRVPGDALQGVYGTDSHIELVGAELLDRFGKAVGHLALLG